MTFLHKMIREAIRVKIDTRNIRLEICHIEGGRERRRERRSEIAREGERTRMNGNETEWNFYRIY